MIKVNPRARRHEDRAGDPLDGLVNLFDLGIVLSVGFLLAALSSLNLASSFTQGKTGAPPGSIQVPSGSTVSQVPSDGQTVVGQGEAVGQVYRLADGSLIYVIPPTGASTAPGEVPTPVSTGVPTGPPGVLPTSVPTGLPSPSPTS